MSKWYGAIAFLCCTLSPAACSTAEQDFGRMAAREIRVSIDAGKYAQALNDTESALQQVEARLQGYDGQPIPMTLIGDYARLARLLSYGGSHIVADKQSTMAPDDRATLQMRLGQAMAKAAGRIQHYAAPEPRLYVHLEDAASLFTDAALILCSSGATDRAGTCIQAAVNLTEQMASFEQAGGALVVWQLDRRLFTREFLACFITHTGDDPKEVYRRAESIIRKYAATEWICKTAMTLEHRLPGGPRAANDLAHYQYLIMLERNLRDNTSDKTLGRLYYELGMLADLLDFLPDGVKWYRRVLEVDPNSDFGSAARRLLEAQADPLLAGYDTLAPPLAEQHAASSEDNPSAPSSTTKDTNQPGSRITPTGSLRPPPLAAREDLGETGANSHRAGTLLLVVSAGLALLLLAVIIQKGMKCR